jgi:hypothetical protein
MATNQKTTTREFKVYRYWPVEYRSIAWVQATTPEEAARLALEEDDDYSDAESCDGSDGRTEIGRIIEVTPDGLEIEHPVVPVGEGVGRRTVRITVEVTVDADSDEAARRQAVELARDGEFTVAEIEVEASSAPGGNE